MAQKQCPNWKTFHSKRVSQLCIPVRWPSLSLLFSWSSTQSFSLQLFWTLLPHQPLLLPLHTCLSKELHSNPRHTYKFVLFSFRLCFMLPLHSVLRAHNIWRLQFKKKPTFQCQRWFYSSPITTTAGWIRSDLQITEIQSLVIMRITSCLML